MLFTSLRCHFCGAKQPYSKTVRQFQCASCDALNFLDGRGGIIDTPVDAVHAATARSFSSTGALDRRSPPPRLDQTPMFFCRTCSKNQHLYNETLANYLPAEDHPKYADFERRLPAFKQELERRYPLICKACAPKAQDLINRADYYGMSQNAAQLLSTTRARGGKAVLRQRDDWWKRGMRLVLFLVGCAANLALLLQFVFHLYGIALALRAPNEDYLPEDGAAVPHFATCTSAAFALRFSPPCYLALGHVVYQSLLVAAGLCWYNPSLRHWFHPTHRIEAILGQRNYYISQFVVLVVRATGHHNLTALETLTTLSSQELIGRHALVIFLAAVTHIFACRGLTPMLWRIKGKIMPRPEDIDVLGASAGPSSERFVAKASGDDPFRYLNRSNHTPDEPQAHFDHLASSSHTPPSRFDQRPHTASSLSTAAFPPSYSSHDTDVDMMDIDAPEPRLEPRTTWLSHTTAPPLGFRTVAHEIADIDGHMRREQDRRIQDQQASLRWQPHSSPAPTNPTPSPFYGALPSAPMTMAQRLRRPQTHSSSSTPSSTTATDLPPSAQHDFMARMRAGIRPLDAPATSSSHTNPAPPDIQPGTLVLPSDVRELAGLEDRFFETVSLHEHDQAAAGKGLYGGWLKGLFG